MKHQHSADLMVQKLVGIEKTEGATVLCKQIHMKIEPRLVYIHGDAFSLFSLVIHVGRLASRALMPPLGARWRVRDTTPGGPPPPCWAAPAAPQVEWHATLLDQSERGQKFHWPLQHDQPPLYYSHSIKQMSARIAALASSPAPHALHSTPQHSPSSTLWPCHAPQSP